MKNQKIGVVIVSYNNPSGASSILRDLYEQEYRIDEIIVVDNSTADDTGQAIKGDFPAVNYFRLKENMGSAGGFAEGLRAGVKNNDFLWMLDDDVHVFKNTLSLLVDGLKSLDNKDNIAVIRCANEALHEKGIIEINGFAWRGTLIRSEAVKKFGIPSEKFFIYGEDMEYGFRLKRAGYKFFSVQESLMRFSRQNQESHRFLGKNTFFYRDPFRLYYSFRNSMSVFLNYKMIKNAARLAAYAAKVILLIVFKAKQDRFNRVTAILEGLVDGLVSKLGKNPKYSPEKVPVK